MTDTEDNRMFGLVAAIICRAYEQKEKPNASDVIRVFGELDVYDTIFLETIEGSMPSHAMGWNLARELKPSTREEIGLFNEIHGMIHDVLNKIENSVPDFDYVQHSDIIGIVLCREKLLIHDSKIVTYQKRDELLLPEFLKGYASPSSPLYKFRKHSMFDPNINRIIAGFLGEKKKKVPRNYYLFNQILEYRLRNPVWCKRLPAAIIKLVDLLVGGTDSDDDAD